MEELVRRIKWEDDSPKNSESFLTREWLVTNGLGGYASGTISGVVTRRYHGLLIAALPNPHGRTVMLNHISEKIILPDKRRIDIGGEETSLNAFAIHGIDYLKEFRLEFGLPVWVYNVDGFIIEKRILLPHKHNTVLISYRLIEGSSHVEFSIRPSVHFRRHEDRVNIELSDDYRIIIKGEKFEIAGDPLLPHLKFHISDDNVSLDILQNQTREIYYRLEASRGYEEVGELWSPGEFNMILKKENEVIFTASTEEWGSILNYNPHIILQEEIQRRRELILKVPDLKENTSAAELVIAAEQFLITPVGRVDEGDVKKSADEEVRTIIAGYHWFTDWGRDTMISLEGLTLSTGRLNHAKWILRTFAHYVRNGLLPNLFPEGEQEGLYHTADASLWYFHAVDRYLSYTKDDETLIEIFPKLKEIIDYHIRGTDFNIHVDSDDGLLYQGKEHFQLTWMDAKVEDWVVTPRRGKAVEINALWYNALCLFVNWIRQLNGDKAAEPYDYLIFKARESFNKKFWYNEGGYLYDVIDGEGITYDNACRPNQIFAISLPNPILGAEKWARVLNIVQEKLLTPVGLRSLAPGHPDYKEKYFGDLRARDAAYHQGTVWAWLIGPFIDAWLKVYPNKKEEAKNLLSGFDLHLSEACIGSISEVFDAETPFTPRGCIAQAWSVAEVLRCMINLNRI